MKIEINKEDVTSKVYNNVIKISETLGDEFNWINFETGSNPNLTFSIDFEQDNKLLCLEIGSTGVGWFGEPGPIFKNFLDITSEENYNIFIEELKKDLSFLFKNS